jgi:hypothetical protein
LSGIERAISKIDVAARFTPHRDNRFWLLVISQSNFSTREKLYRLKMGWEAICSVAIPSYQKKVQYRFGNPMPVVVFASMMVLAKKQLQPN